MASSSVSNVRAEILSQHMVIRTSIATLSSLAKKSNWPTAVETLRDSLGRFAALFEAHLSFEESELVPLLLVVDASGPARVTALLDEHLGQRTQIEDVYASVEAASWGETDDHVHDVLELIDDLLADMEEEEEMLDALVAIDRRARLVG